MILRVFRWSPDGGGERLNDFRIEPGEHTTVLDALVRLREEEAPDLAFRYACRVGMCGSCAVVVDGRERWACRTRLSRIARRDAPDTIVTVRPLYHFPLIRDLVVDMKPFVDRMKAAGAAFVPREPETAPEAAPRTTPKTTPKTTKVAAIGAESRERRAIDAAVECIGCGACVSACTMVRWDPRFPGPAALNRAFTLAEDSRDAGMVSRGAALFGEDGVWRCHGQAQCTAVCPMELSPSDSILRLRRRAIGSLFLRV